MKADTGLLLCTGVNMFICVKRQTEVSGPIFHMYCCFFSNISLSFSIICSMSSDQHEAFYCTQTEEGTKAKNPPVSVSFWTVKTWIVVNEA